MLKSNLVIQEPTKPFITKLVVSLLYTCFFGYTIYLFAYRDFWNHPERWSIIIYLSILLCILFSSSFMAIASHSIHINFEHQKIQHRYRVGLFNYKEVWQNLEELEYIAVFRTGDYYQINMWYQKNNILNLMTLDDPKKAIENGYLIADKLNIDLLDARERGFHKWVNKNIYKNTGKVVYIT